MHLLIDGTLARELTVEELVTFLQIMPKVINMTPITAPMVSKSEGGFVGIILIAESHISVHTTGLNGWVDIFSCKPFDTMLALEKTQELLQLIPTRFKLLERELPSGHAD